MLEKSFENTFLFEISWEVCNKVGGIYTVIRTKLKQARENFDDNYILIGPLLDRNRHFVEDNSLFAPEIFKILQEKNLNCKFGYWDAEGCNPRVVLVDFRNRYNLSLLLYNLWVDFGVDSLASNYDFHEPILFATAAAEIIEAISQSLSSKNMKVIAHFHEWMTGAGLLYLKKNCDNIATVFTTHATVLGRCLSGDGKLIYDLPKNFDTAAEAKKYGGGVFSKHSVERAAAKNADCFTTVSNITADEAYLMLGKYPDKVVFNGLDIERKQHLIQAEIFNETRAKLRQIAASVIGREIPENSLLWVTSGRYEFHNKGFDVLLKSLALLEKHLPKDAPPIVVFFLLAVNWRSADDSLLNKDVNTVMPDQNQAVGIATHRVYNPHYDSIIRSCNELGLRNPDSKIHIVYSDAYLNGMDGVFEVIYEQILAACDLSIFPSIYEPWGYTPLESISYATPTATTDLAGFGDWVNGLERDHRDAITILPRKNIKDDELIVLLNDYFQKVVALSQDAKQVSAIRDKSRNLATIADWQNFYKEYLNAYLQALNFNEIYRAKYGTEGLEEQFITTIHEAEALFPRFRLVQYECPLPEKLCRLRDLAYNFWWSWHEDAKLLFQKINPELWQQVKRNPVHFLNLVASSDLHKAAASDSYMKLYNSTLDLFGDYTKAPKRPLKFCGVDAITKQRPIAYFCLEYGIDECLPIYSGGLGILAGDYLKAMSDLWVPMIAVGLFYKQGYFLQKINARGEQVALYEARNISQIPMKPIIDEAGKPLLIAVEILGRNVYAKVWEVQVGHVTLYLLDTDVEENSSRDRKITNNLYGGTREDRLKQEMILGIGGVRFILERLKIDPIVYHLNEGHSAFLLLERIKSYRHHGYSFQEAVEMVRSSSVFTTHTPVPAGNEEFAAELIKRYFANYVETLGISMQSLLNLAKDSENSARKVFSMTGLALRLSLNANAVSTLHGKVARDMWQDMWPGLLKVETPITHVTNGVHLQTWLGAPMKELYDDYLPIDWDKKQDDPKLWEKIAVFSDNKLWDTHQAQKEKLIELVKDTIIKQYSLRNENKQLINNSLKCLNKDTLLIGIARRFTAYKRNDLILKDKERLARILTDVKCPVVMLIAGKAHPADGSGNNLIREIIQILREHAFKGHIIFIEEYNITLAKAMVRGVDVWLNMPILGREACGTSGMKAGMNGALNFSTKDGWWDEAYNERIGWYIKSMSTIDDLAKRNDVENMFLLNILENEIVPLYYEKKTAQFSAEWVGKMKASIALTAQQYNTYRMARDYVDKLYCPTMLFASELSKNAYKNLKDLVTWKTNIADRFNTVKVKAILMNGIKDGKIIAKGLVKVKLLLFSGKVYAKELRAELILAKSDGKKFIEPPVVVPLKLSNGRETGVLIYSAEYQIEDTGFYSYGVRIYPTNELLYREQGTNIVYWG